MFLIFILSMYPWFAWKLNTVYIYLLGIPLVTLLYTNNYCKRKSEDNLIIIASFFFFLWLGKTGNIYGLFEHFINWVIFVSVLTLKDDYKIDIIKFTTKWFSLLLLLSLVFYILYLIGIPLPNSRIVRDGYRSELSNYYFFVCFEGSMRFQSVFLEPGHMTMGLAPLLFINKYDIKKLPVLVMTMAQFFSFSLAGYLVFLFGFLYQSVLQKGKKSVLYPTAMISFFAIFLFASNYVFQANLFKDLILSRMEWDGTSIVGDDRSSYYLDKQYDRYKQSSVAQFFTGIGYDGEKSEKGVSGYKFYMVNYGLIGLFLLIVFYYQAIAKRPRTRWDYGFLILMMLLLYQNSYPIWWCMLVSLSCGKVYMKNNEEEPIILADNKPSVAQHI